MIILPSHINSILITLGFLRLVTGSQILTTSGFISCLPESNITVQNLDIKYNADEKQVTFDVTGTSASEQNVTAQLNVVAYGINVYQRSFDPCSSSTYVSHLCPGMSCYPISHLRLIKLKYPRDNFWPLELK